MMKKCLVLFVLLLCVVHCAPAAEEVVLPTATRPGGEGIGRVQRDEPFPTYPPPPSPTFTPTPQPTPKPTRPSTAVPFTEPATTASPRPTQSPYIDYSGEVTQAGIEMIQQMKREGGDFYDAITATTGLMPKRSFTFMDGDEEVWTLVNSGSVYRGGGATGGGYSDWCQTVFIRDNSIQYNSKMCGALFEVVDFDNDGFEEMFFEETSFVITFIDKKEGGNYEFVQLWHPLSLKFDQLTAIEKEGEQYIITVDERASYDTSKLVYRIGSPLYNGSLPFTLSWLDHDDAPERSAVILPDDYEIESRSNRFVIDQTDEQPRLLLDELSPVQIFFRSSACRDSFVGIVEPDKEIEYRFSPRYERHSRLNLGVVTDGKHIVHLMRESESGEALDVKDAPDLALSKTEGLQASYQLELHNNYVIRVSTEADTAVQYTLHIHFC